MRGKMNHNGQGKHLGKLILVVIKAQVTITENVRKRNAITRITIFLHEQEYMKTGKIEEIAH